MSLPSSTSTKQDEITTERFKRNMEDAKQKLIALKKSMKEPKLPQDIEVLNPSKDAGIIIYFKKINEKIKKNFKVYQEIADVLTIKVKGPPTGNGAETGKIWHKSLEKYIANPEMSANEIGKAVIDAVTEWLKDGNDGLELLESEFRLHGFMKKEDDVESFWSGNVDAVGWYKDNYVIVEWKAVDTSKFWEENNQAYGDYLHQCLVYARLLKLHLKLFKLPYILIVPISSKTGKNIIPALFTDFPEECKDEIEKYEWFTVWKPAILSLPSGMFNNVDEIRGDDGRVHKDKKLRDVLKDGYTVKQFLLDKHGLDEDCTVKQLLETLVPRSLDHTIEQLLYGSKYDEIRLCES